MIERVNTHVRAHAIACVALCCSLLSLAGASYAALALPPNSVGSRQLINGSIAPVKMDPREIGGTIRHWAKISAQGQVLASSSRAHAGRSGNEITIDWGDKFPEGRCIALATIRGHADSTVDPVEAIFGPHEISPTSVVVTTFNLNPGPAAAESIFIAVIC